MKASDAHDLLELVGQVAAGKEGEPLVELNRLMAVLRDEIANAEEDEPEPDSYDITVTSKDLAITIDTTVAQTMQLERFDLARELAQDHRVFVVEDAVPAGTLPPDELVFRKAKTP